MTNETQRSAITRTRAGAIAAFLDGAGVPFELIEHEEVMSAAAEARVVHEPSEQVAKTVVPHDRSAYVIAAIPAADRLDLHKLRVLPGASRKLRLASEAEIARDFPSLDVGAAPPFGRTVPTAQAIDKTLLEQEQIVCPAGDHRHSVGLDSREVL